jgi:rubrerythrin
MPTDQEKTLNGLRIAVQMEIDGKDFYLKASQTSRNTMGKKLLHSLAEAEDEHRRKFISVYEAIRDEKAWPKTALKPGVTGNIKTIFSTATKRMATGVKPLAEELDAVQTAMQMENKTFDFYSSRETLADGESEKDFYRTIAAEERQHHLLLEDYYEFLKNPADWFVKSEHHSLDGG